MVGDPMAPSVPIAPSVGADSAFVYSRNDAWPDVDGVGGVGLVDCDVHITVPSLNVLHPYLEERWQDYLTESGVGNLDSGMYPRSAPISAVPGSAPASGPAGSDLALLRTQLLDPMDTRYAVVNCVYGVDAIHNDDWAAAMARAVNDWQIAEWLEPEPRLRGSIVLPCQNAEFAAAEIDRIGHRPDLVQVLLPVRSREPLGRRRYWPIYAAAQRRNLVVGIHAGGVSGNPITPVGWPTYYLEDYVNLAQTFQSQVLSLVSEGVFTEFPQLRVVLIEGGFTWMPPLMWRFDKNWKGLRREVPWVKQVPSEIIREHIRLTTQPMDEPDDSRQLSEVIEQLDSDDMLLFSTDYPHWQFDAIAEALPDGLSTEQQRKILSTNALDTYQLPDHRSEGNHG